MPQPEESNSADVSAVTDWAESFSKSPAYPCTFKLRFLNDQDAKEALSYFRECTALLVADTTFHVASVNIKSETYQDLVAKSVPVDAFRLVFRSPTYLTMKGAGFRYLFPEPRRLFLNLAKLWNQNAKGYEIGNRFLCDFYNVPLADIAVNAAWLRRHASLGTYFPDLHMMILPKLAIETPLDCYVVVHEWQHHAFHAGHHR